MIQELQWDSAFFKKKIGTLVMCPGEEPKTAGALEKARRAGFQYLTWKTKSFDIPVTQALESEGFYLADIGVTLSAKPDVLCSAESAASMRWMKSPRAAELQDIPMLRDLARGLFLQSRFYHDPFFSKKEADRLYQQWIENSVKGSAADIVFCIDTAGFITCRKTGRRSGEIVLVGVRQRMRGKSMGTALVLRAMQWFSAQGLGTATVRTQLRNPDAMNFYLRLGFLVREYDLVFGKRL